MRIRFLCVALLACSVSAVADDIDFNRDVRPILSDACFACHGPDGAQRQADLRIDTKEGIFRALDGITIVKPGDSDHSELLRRVTAKDDDEVMPPPDAGRRLTADEVGILKAWIEQGAKHKGHWAYIAPQKPDVPQNIADDPAKIVDHFINRTLQQKGLKPAAAADATTLIRRLSFDLTGLPPSKEVLAAYANEPNGERWQQLISQTLASDAYAERMTTMWLDLVRYADTNGIHGDNHRDIWMYRDWVINAFRNNMPFDQFTIEQLAGDLLPDATDQQRIASGYNRLLMTTREGGAQAKEYLAKYSADRVRNASTVWMGATMGCCECHDHKFDPYSIKDFYSFAAFFADVKDVPVGVQPSVKMPSADQKRQRSELDQQLAALQKTLDTQTPELDKAFAAWATDLHAKRTKSANTWVAAPVVDMKSLGGQVLQRKDDGTIVTAGPHPEYDTYRIVVSPAAGNLAGIRLTAFPDDSFVKKSLSRPPGNGNFVVSGMKVSLIRDADKSTTPITIKNAVATFNQKDWNVAAALDGQLKTGWAVDGHVQVKQPSAAFRFAEAATLQEGDRLVVEIEQKAVVHHNIGRFRLDVTSINDAPAADRNTFGLPENLVAIVDAWPTANDKQKTELANHYRTIAPQLNETRQQHATVTKQRKQLEDSIPKTLITQTQKPRQIRVLGRGNWMDDSGDIVQPAVPTFLPAVSASGRASRLDLAHWFLEDDNPVVARVYVNRIWKMMFGAGIVKSADDFGSQGSWPTHPELLDFLAIEFRNSGWNVQHIIRIIASTDAYRRSSAATAELREVDPFNQWLARQSRFRLDAEFIRDNALAVSGLLVEQVGGPSVKPYQPEGYWKHLNFPKRKWQPDAGDNQHRRGLYTYWCRTFLHPAMRSFDAPTREECSVERPRSNNSLQALVLLNDPSYVEAAKAFATQAITAGGSTTAERLEFMFRKSLSRSPRPDELKLLKDLVARQEKQTTEPEATRETTVWTAVARVILNLHEAITRS